VLKLVTPWGIEWWLFVRRARRAADAHEAERARRSPPRERRVEEAIMFLRGRGLNEQQVRAGSVPAHSLDYIGERVFERLPSDRPVRALHIGNFVGVSLCYLSWLVTDRHPGSVVVSIDPNASHRGIENPQGHALALLHHFDLLQTNVIISGYTLDWTPGEQLSSDGVACENVLASLARLGTDSFDLVLLDGNHEESYLARELDALRGLLAAGSILVFDDIDELEGVRSVFGRVVAQEEFVSLGEEGRVGILQLAAKPAGNP
jgi:Methyltransferase domain